MRRIFQYSGIAVAIAFASFCCMVAAGLMFAVATNPAHAGAARVVATPPNPVTVEMQQTLTKEVNTFTTCLGTRIFDARATNPAMVRMEAANNQAGWAAANRDLAAWNTAATAVRAELPGLKTTYGC